MLPPRINYSKVLFLIVRPVQHEPLALLYTFHLHSLHSRGQARAGFVSRPVAQQHHKLAIAQKAQKKQKETQQYPVLIYSFIFSTSLYFLIVALPSCWDPEAPFLAARHCVNHSC